ncbi:hypothetical protein GCM10010357_32420 [Streptomyces luteireticuli]|uniref:Uncharacterized protein n=1 Tax=Streptomyces luteireticuli TaxID=173858 RepID=A0ABP3IN33_9ACTN
MKASIAPVKPSSISAGRPVCNSATSGNIHRAVATQPVRHIVRRPTRSPIRASGGVASPMTATAAITQPSITVRPTPSRSVP